MLEGWNEGWTAELEWVFSGLHRDLKKRKENLSLSLSLSAGSVDTGSGGAAVACRDISTLIKHSYLHYRIYIL